MSTASRFRAAEERMAKAGIHLPRCIEHVEDEAEDLAAQSFDPTGRSNVSSVLVCSEHGVDLTDCHAAERTCVVAISVPVHADPTGEAAVRTSRARNALAELERKTRAFENLAHWFDDFVHDHHPRAARPANPTESRKAAQENAKPPGCTRCTAQGKWSPPHTKEPTDVGGILETPELVCQGHYDRIRTTQRPTSPEDDRHYAKKGKWPKMTQSDRLRAGIVTGELV